MMMKYPNDQLNGQELENALRLHELWLTSQEQEGRQLTLTGVIISNIDLRGRRLSRSILDNVVFKDTSLRETQFGGAALINSGFERCDLNGAFLSHARFQNVRIHQCSCINITLGGEYCEVIFSVSDLTQANMSKIIMRGCILSSVSLQQARIYKSLIEDTSFTDVSFQSAEFFKSHFYRCELKLCSLQNAIMHKTEFFDVEMTNVHGRPTCG